MEPLPPLFRRIADELRAKIRSGELAPNAQLPTQAELMRQYDVSDGVIKAVMRTLASEGLIQARRGAGTFVKARPTRQRLPRSWWRPARGGSPFLQDMAAHGMHGSWAFDSETVQASPEIRDRLGLDEPDSELPDVMRTAYTFMADDEPVQLATSYEPWALTKGEPIAYPEAGPHAGQGVVERMAVIGITVTHWSEVVSARPASTVEAQALKIGAGALVLTIERTYFAETRPVETADIAIPVDRYEIVYGAPVREASGE
ncbi:GntR family transcriptional regulator [Acrocarpospora macrocephala]|uniref:GntR family transcriptional regulator n=1 Tax=Acrocarpospora macrocephala TaxID=150177 RepID=UPI001FE9D16A|nr:GntR family transcriptional regulator [Acrocarpospora macrocephala]